MKGRGWLKEFDFADVGSREMAKAAPTARRPSAYLIVGEPASGKTRLGTAIIRRALSLEPIRQDLGFPSGNAPEILGRAAKREYLFLDDFKPRRGYKFEALCAFLTSKEWSHRPFRKVTVETNENRTLVIISANPTVKVPVDLLKRCHVIRMKGGE